ncbi:MAG TPA: hypothetical protein DEP72_06105 [Clostridiales bacterium]|nr:MAG: hypothetical protein A2Y18_01520 [Clostridiales bacterium GWD2_32_19]HCC07712.1 hypothetical protein [Clostridiales bacterium]
MNIVNNSGIVIFIKGTIICYQNSVLYKITQKMRDYVINILRNSYVAGCIFNENKGNDYFENSITYRIILWVYKTKRDMFRCLIKWSNESSILIILSHIKKVGTKCFESLFEIYKYSIIYNMYLDWIESEVI